jgi:hypothetical protein
MTPSGIEPAPFRFVEQCLNQLRHRIWKIQAEISLFPREKDDSYLADFKNSK